jgi:4-amino-4-deoxy-L-arabinose transferase-like glycosyltransferase
MNDMAKTIIETIKYFVIIGLEISLGLLIKYILPFFIPILVIAILILKLHWEKLHIIIFMLISFFVLIFGPQVLYKIITHEYNKNLISISLYFSIQAIIVLLIIFHKLILK